MLNLKARADNARAFSVSSSKQAWETSAGAIVAKNSKKSVAHGKPDEPYRIGLPPVTAIVAPET